jgi:hypothetical protein
LLVVTALSLSLSLSLFQLPWKVGALGIGNTPLRIVK